MSKDTFVRHHVYGMTWRYVETVVQSAFDLVLGYVIGEDEAGIWIGKCPRDHNIYSSTRHGLLALITADYLQHVRSDRGGDEA